MGLLSKGTPLTWEEAQQHAEHVRKHGVRQFVNIWRRLRGVMHQELLWGDEVEYVLVQLREGPDGARRPKLLLRGAELLATLQQPELDAHGGPVDVLWRPEYGQYMLESTPGAPYGSSAHEFLAVEPSMVLRRKLVKQLLGVDEHLMTITAFPRLGSPHFLEPDCAPLGKAAQSLFIPDEAINDIHPRFRTLTANIRKRRQSKVAINLPIFKDTHTPSPFVEQFPPSPYPNGATAALPDHIYMDCMCFGMGCCCLQVTFQACSLDEARLLYDQLAPWSPVLLALTAAAPIFRGYLADVDVRWQVISGSVDDRTPEERGLEPLKHNKFRIPKSRYDSIDSFLSDGPDYRPEYNDVELVYDQAIYDELRQEGVDHLLARHIAHLFIRDPLVIYRELLNQDDEQSTDHFENIQSTNWQTMRFKPPPPNSPIGWRVEFRSMEVQLTDFENAAFVVFIVLLTRAILSFNLNFYIPMSKIEANMQTAFKRDACRTQKFYFRKNVFSCRDAPRAAGPVEDEYDLFTMDEIFNGRAGTPFQGILPLLSSYLDSINANYETRCAVGRYLEFLSRRASGELVTPATWMRSFVQTHSAYKHDSVVPDEVAFDLLRKCAELAEGTANVPELLGGFNKRRL
eukprot:Unigene3041_Nuclearia_a/m.9354 Unigene3041_Nuclearia_a/g.9354  ORF Unigene3041_Nuclearia_a/g.9354 Unigene3041_Nuclearia_a/m.9354 type:complete len:628 (-) Unigene3041_Nuclearia_a:92-1975(-)